MTFVRTWLSMIAAAGCAPDPAFSNLPEFIEPPIVGEPRQCIHADPKLVDFGGQAVGDEQGALSNVVIANPCLETIVVSSVGLAAPDTPFSVVEPLDHEVWLRPGEQVSIPLRFDPWSYLPVAGRLVVHTGDDILPDYIVALRGDGICPGGDADTDADLVPDACDVCEGHDDRLDRDRDGVPDDCDWCPDVHDSRDEDHDGVADPCDVCRFGDDTADGDKDGMPDDCDPCPLGLNWMDADGDLIADACDRCPGFPDWADLDEDGVPNGCDACPGFDDALDADGDGVPDGCEAP